VKGGSFDQGFDDVMFRGTADKGEVWIVEYKGGGSRLAVGQMEPEWVLYNIRRLCLSGGTTGQYWARLLATAANEGRLHGVAFSTPIKAGVPKKTKAIRAPWQYKMKVTLPQGC
jgi:hypothetical protein